MRVSIPFNLPQDNKEYTDCCLGKNYREIIQNQMDYLIAYDPSGKTGYAVIIDIMKHLEIEIKSLGVGDGSNNKIN